MIPYSNRLELSFFRLGSIAVRVDRIGVMILLVALFTTVSIYGAESHPSSSPPPSEVLLTDNLGRLVKVPTNSISADLLPRTTAQQANQIPQSNKGTRQSNEVSERIKSGQTNASHTVFFPATQPPLAPYLANLDEWGNTAIQPNSIFSSAPLEPGVQRAKYWLSEHGFRYSLQQAFTGVGMSDVMQGDNVIGYYSLNLEAKWTVFQLPEKGAAWISIEADAKSGLGAAGNSQSASQNLGTLTQPSGNWSAINGFRLPEIAWQQSWRDGRFVVVAGVVDQGNYIDGNAYANEGRGQFINSALINSNVLPLPAHNFGLNLQWQPVDDWYFLVGTSRGNASAEQLPWTDFDRNAWSVVGEIGYAPDDVLGWGPGVYRLQPFIAEDNGPTQGGIGFNFQQQLGENSPFGWFGRVGFGGSAAAAGARAQVGTGFVTHEPLWHLGLQTERTDDVIGVGFVWSQPSATDQTVFHENEYIVETFYALQVTPLMKIQPDFQVVWNPAFNPDPGPSVVGQLQLVLSW